MTKTASKPSVALLFSAALLTGCGFHPLYGSAFSGGGPQAEIAAIDVPIIPDRPGQILRQALQQRFDQGQGVAKRYILTVSLGIAGDAIAIQRDSTATRVRQVATATWTLKALDPASTLVTSGTARALDGVNIIDQQYFAADLEGETATRRIIDTVADQITQQIASFFARRSGTT